MPQKHLAGRSHSVFVFIAGHRGNLAKDRCYLETPGRMFRERNGFAAAGAFAIDKILVDFHDDSPF